MFIENFTKIENSLPSFDHMVYIRIFEGCNLSCEHCFIPANPKKMDLSFFESGNLGDQLLKNSNIKEGQTLYLQWHGGEPTALGVDYLSKALNDIAADKRFNYVNGIQTNLINFSSNTNEWAEIYKKYFNSEVGISWDPKIRHLKRNVSSVESSLLYDEVFWQNVKLAQDSGLNLYFIITATKIFFESFKSPFTFFQYMIDRGVKKINLERITNTGEARENWDRLGLSNREYSEYMSKFYKAYILFKDNNPDIDFNISPFDGLLQSVISLVNNTISKDTQGSGYGCWSGSCDSNFHTVDSSGYKHGCTALTSEIDNSNKKLNENLTGKKIIWLNKSSSNKEHLQNVRAERKISCLDCSYNPICSSGCLSVEKWDSSGECSGGSILFKNIEESVKRGFNN